MRPLIIALDFETKQKVDSFLDHFHESLYVKVGMELYYQEGPKIIDYLKEKGHQIFLDLKLHDIPNTVKQAMKRLANLEVDMVNVHALGGSRMMEAALEGLESGATRQQRPTIIAVTQLTSSDEQMVQKEQMISLSLENSVRNLARLAKQSGLDGVVCSAHEVGIITDVCGESFQTITPGIRLADDQNGDQVRVATPQLARKLGATGIVVGRSITRAKDPYRAYQQVKSEWEGVYE